MARPINAFNPGDNLIASKVNENFDEIWSERGVEYFTFGESIAAGQAVYLGHERPVMSLEVNASDDATIQVYGDRWYAQTFKTSSRAKFITGIWLKGRHYSSVSGNITLSIRAVDANNKPTGADLVSKDIAASSWPANISNVWMFFEFSTPLAVSANTQYAIVLRAPGGSSSYYIRWYQHNSNIYSDGYSSFSSNGGVTWETANVNDHAFRVYEIVDEKGKVYTTYANGLANTTVHDFIGIAKESGTADQSKAVQVAGIVSGLSGLVAGTDYYLVNSAGAISATKGSVIKKIGTAVSATQLLLTAQKNAIAWGQRERLYKHETREDIVLGFKPRFVHIWALNNTSTTFYTSYGTADENGQFALYGQSHGTSESMGYSGGRVIYVHRGGSAWTGYATLTFRDFGFSLDWTFGYDSGILYVWTAYQ